MSTHSAFPTTRWSHVILARAGGEEAAVMLNDLCGRYWRPIYAFARHRGLSSHDAEDMTQSYFARLLGEGRVIDRADRSKGRFRAFLIQDFKFFLANQVSKGNTQKRGGGVSVISMDTAWAEERLGLIEAADADAEAYFDRQWALETIRQAREQVAQDYARQNKQALFAVLQAGLLHPPNAAKYEQWQQELGMSVGALKVALSRLRERFRKTLETQIRETVTTPEELKEEMRHLRQVLSRTQRGV